MSRSKSKNRSETEYFKGEIKRLQKQLRQMEKNKQLYNTKNEKKVTPETPVTNKCEDCGKGVLSLVISMAEREIYSCNVCFYRKVIKL